MDLTSSSEVFSKWKRPLLGGLLSTAIAGITIAIFYWKTNPITGFFGLVFMFPAYLVESFIVTIRGSSYNIGETLGNIISLGFWLVSGFLIAKRFKNDKSAIGCWLLLYLGLIPIGFGVFFLKTLLLR